jgi:hypothetical protein
MKKKFTLLLFAAGALLTVSAWSQNPQLSGKWKLESASVVQDNGSTTNLNVDAAKENITFSVFDELIFAGEQLTFVSGEVILEGPVTIASDLIQTTSTPMPLLFEWKIAQGKLHLEHEQSGLSPDKTNISYKISSVYIKQ